MTAAGSYDGIYRLKNITQSGTSPASSYTFVYDGSGNRTKRTVGGAVTDYTVPDNRVQTASGGWTFDYDYEVAAPGNGCMVAKKQSGTSKAKYEWDSINRLKAIEVPGVSRTEYSYDAFDRRYKMVVKTPSGGGWTSGTTSGNWV